MRIILVDDEEFIRLGLEKILSKMDLNIEVVGSFGNGLEALTHLMRLGPSEVDALITDIKMPMMDGLKLIERVRERMEDLPVIVLSGFSEFEYARTAMRYGAADYLLKPIDKSQLYDVLKRIEAMRMETAAPTESVEDEGDHEHYVIEEIKGILEREYDNQFELEKLAERIGKSASYISRLFSQKTNMTITDYLIQIRIEKAKQFLVDHPNLKNYEISQLVGYSDPVYFNKLFKKMVGSTPKEYREKYLGS